MERYSGTPFLVIAFIFITLGILLYFFHPKRTTFLFGYRTSRSMQSIKHWAVAQKYSAKCLLIGGLLQLLGYLISSQFPNHSIVDYTGLFLTFLTIALVFILTENKLKNLP